MEACTKLSDTNNLKSQSDIRQSEDRYPDMNRLQERKDKPCP